MFLDPPVKRQSSSLSDRKCVSNEFFKRRCPRERCEGLRDDDDSPPLDLRGDFGPAPPLPVEPAVTEDVADTLLLVSLSSCPAGRFTSSQRCLMKLLREGSGIWLLRRCEGKVACADSESRSFFLIEEGEVECVDCTASGSFLLRRRTLVGVVLLALLYGSLSSLPLSQEAVRGPRSLLSLFSLDPVLTVRGPRSLPTLSLLSVRR